MYRDLAPMVGLGNAEATDHGVRKREREREREREIFAIELPDKLKERNAK